MPELKQVQKCLQTRTQTKPSAYIWCKILIFIYCPICYKFVNTVVLSNLPSNEAFLSFCLPGTAIFQELLHWFSQYEYWNYVNSFIVVAFFIQSVRPFVCHCISKGKLIIFLNFYLKLGQKECEKLRLLKSWKTS